MSDIEKIRETYTKDGGDWDEWPYPTEEIESRLSGELRARVLKVLEHDDDGAEVILVESKVSGGYSEYTQENDCEIEVKIGGCRVWSSGGYTSLEPAMSTFLMIFG